MAQIFSVTNQKGGVAKTTTSLALAQAFAESEPEKKVLFIDLDSQRNATAVLLKKLNFEPEETVYNAFAGNPITSKQIHPTSQPNLFVVPASLQLIETESQLAGSLDGFFRLNDSLSEIKSEFSYIFLDCPPSLSLITINAMVTANYLLIPLQTSKFSIDGIQSITDAVATVKKRYNPHLKILGGILTMFDSRTTLSQAMAPEVAKFMHVFSSNIPRSVIVEEAHLLKESLLTYAGAHRVAQAYRALAREVKDVIRSE